MKKSNKTLWIVLGIIVVLVVWLWSGYNGMVNKQEVATTALADVQATYQRRADLIPNLANTVQAYAKHEKSTFAEVAKARSAASQLKLGDNATPAQNITAEQFASLYTDCGFRSAVSRDAGTLSYMTYLNDNIALLAIDGCEYQEYGDSLKQSGHIDEPTADWIRTACGNALDTGRKIIAISSHIIAAPFKGFATLGNTMNNYDAISLAAFTGGATDEGPKYAIDNASVQALLAQCGVTAVFTAGTNASDIQCISTEQDGSFYQVNTGFATAYECPLRTVSFQSDGISITTDFVKDFTAPEGLTFEDYAYYRTLNELPNGVTTGVLNYWPQLQVFLTERFTFEIDETQEVDFLRDRNLLFHLPETGEELANNINRTVIPPLVKVITLFAQGSKTIPERKAMLAAKAQELEAEIYDLQSSLDFISYRQQYYDRILEQDIDGAAEVLLESDMCMF